MDVRPGNEVNSTISTTSTGILRDIADFETWLEDNRIPVNRTRVEEISKALIDHTPETVARLPASDAIKLTAYLFDAFTFSLIYRQLRLMDHHSLPRKLIADAIEGPSNPADERPGHHTVNARNRLFELELACRFMAHGHAVEGFDDIILRVNGAKVNIQCKRISKPDTFVRNCEMAIGQLGKRLPLIADYGVVAVSLDMAIGMTTRLHFPSSPEELVTTTRMYLKAYHAPLQRCFADCVDTRIIGGMVDLKCLGITPSPRQFVMTRQSASAHLDAGTSLLHPERQIFQALIETHPPFERSSEATP